MTTTVRSATTPAHVRLHSASSTTRSALIVTGGHHREPEAASHAPSAVSRVASTPAKAHRQENTYRISPAEHFPCAKVQEVVRDVLSSRLRDVEYDPRDTGLPQELAELIKQKTKALGPSRYKLVSFVMVGQKSTATLSFASRCSWNEQYDNYTEASYENKSLYATGIVYSVYQE